MSRCYTQITLADRRRLQQLMTAKVSINEMARLLGRHRSTIYREIRRNTCRVALNRKNADVWISFGI